MRNVSIINDILTFKTFPPESSALRNYSKMKGKKLPDKGKSEIDSQQSRMFNHISCIEVDIR